MDKVQFFYLNPLPPPFLFFLGKSLQGTELVNKSTHFPLCCDKSDLGEGGGEGGSLSNLGQGGRVAWKIFMGMELEPEYSTYADARGVAKGAE